MRAAEGRLSTRAPAFEGFGVAIDGEPILCRVDWALPARGVACVWGPEGAGKTTLGRVLARHALPSQVRTWGQLTCAGVDWRVRPPAFYITPTDPPLGGTLGECLTRHIPPRRLLEMTEQQGGDAAEAPRRWVEELLTRYPVEGLQRDSPTGALEAPQRLMLRVLIGLARDAEVIFIDEALAALAPAQRATPAALIEQAGRERLVLLASRAPPTDAPAMSVSAHMRQGVLPWAPSQDVPAAPEAPPAWLRWILHGQLAGMPRPGRDGDLEGVIQALRAQGITHVLCLEESHIEPEALAGAGLQTWHMPIEDMHAPGLEQTLQVCARGWAAIARGARLAIHCKAGIGRTGTLLAAMLMTRGWRYSEALMFLRGIQSHYIQSQAQRDFLQRLEEHL